MKRLLVFVFLLPIICTSQYTLIPDSIFEQELINLGYDTIHDGQVLTANISSIDSLYLQAPFAATVRILSLIHISEPTRR